MRTHFTIAIVLILGVSAAQATAQQQSDISLAFGHHTYSETTETGSGDVTTRLYSRTLGVHFRYLFGDHFELAQRQDIRFPFRGSVAIGGQRQAFGPDLFDYFLALDTALNTNYHAQVNDTTSLTIGPGVQFGILGYGITLSGYGVTSEVRTPQYSIGPNLETTARFALGESGVVRVSVAPYYDLYAWSGIAVPGDLQWVSGAVDQFGLNITASIGVVLE